MISALNGKTVSALSSVAAPKTAAPAAATKSGASDAAVVQISSGAKALAQSTASSDVGSGASGASATSGASGAPGAQSSAGARPAGPPPGGKPPSGAPPAGGAGGSSKTKEAASDPADTNGDGTVSAAEQAIYDLTHSGAATTASAQSDAAGATSITGAG